MVLFPLIPILIFCLLDTPRPKIKKNHYVVKLKFCIHNETERARVTKEERIKELSTFLLPLALHIDTFK